MKITFCAIDESLCRCFRAVWPNVHSGDIRKLTDVDAWVSPANSLGWMDGGIDTAYVEFFGNQLQEEVMAAIAALPRRLLPVGQAILHKTRSYFPDLIIAPTMPYPAPIKDVVDVYRSTWAAARCAYANGFNHIVFPGMGTLTGRVPSPIAAALMAGACEIARAEVSDTEPTHRNTLNGLTHDGVCALESENGDFLNLLSEAAPMLDRLAHYEGNVNQPAKALADRIRAATSNTSARKKP